MSWSSRRKWRESFVPYTFLERIIFNVFVLSQCRVYQTNFQNMHTFTYQKTLLRAPFCLFLKSSKAFSVFLKWGQLYSKISKSLNSLKWNNLTKTLPIKEQALRAALINKCSAKSYSTMEYFSYLLKNHGNFLCRGQFFVKLL